MNQLGHHMMIFSVLSQIVENQDESNQASHELHQEGDFIKSPHFTLIMVNQGPFLSSFDHLFHFLTISLSQLVFRS